LPEIQRFSDQKPKTDMKPICITLLTCLLTGIAAPESVFSEPFVQHPPAGYVKISEGDYRPGDDWRQEYIDPKNKAAGLRWVKKTANSQRKSVSVPTFYMQPTLVTKAEWDTVRAWALAHGYPATYGVEVKTKSGTRTVQENNLAAGWADGPNNPVSHVNWYDVVKWCNAKSEMEGRLPSYKVKDTNASGREVYNVYRVGQRDDVECYAYDGGDGYRLPFDAEWEKAARGVDANGAALDGFRFPWGDDITHQNATYYSHPGSSFDVSATRMFHPLYGTRTSPVGSFAPNSYGLYDMWGNMNQWCGDVYGGGTPPATPSQGLFPNYKRVYRGASYNSFAAQTLKFKGAQNPRMRTMIGFRLVAD
jgi:formylglycine-generating enzyme required for sulfatase activity